MISDGKIGIINPFTIVVKSAFGPSSPSGHTHRWWGFCGRVFLWYPTDRKTRCRVQQKTPATERPTIHVCVIVISFSIEQIRQIYIPC